MHSHNSTHVTSPTSHQSQPNHTLLSDSYEPGDVYGVILGESGCKLIFTVAKPDTGNHTRHKIRLVRPTDETPLDGDLIYSGTLTIATKPPSGLGEERFVTWLDSFSPRLRPVPEYPALTQATQDSDDTRTTTEFLDDTRGTGQFLAVIHGRNGRQLALEDDGYGDQDCFLVARGPDISDSLGHGTHGTVPFGAELCSIESAPLAELREFTVLHR
jgi:hypothetical protein